MISVVIPAYNEADSLERLHHELAAVAAAQGYELDIVFVDDGSNDGTWDRICRLSEGDPRVRGIRLRRNFGKAAALSAGFRAARGELVMTLDADLQDDPAEIPRFLDKLAEGYDVVSGWKEIRHDPWHKVYPSRVFNWLVSRLTGVVLHDHNCGMKCYRRQVLAEVRLYGEMHRFVPVLAAARGFRIGEIPIRHRPRSFGHSKYGVWRIVKGFLDLMTVVFLTGFGERPQHLIGSVGLLSFLTGLLGMFYVSFMWIITRVIPGTTPYNIHEKAMIYYSLGGMLLGVQLLSIGFLAELITHTTGRGVDSYSILEETGANRPPDRPAAPPVGAAEDGVSPAHREKDVV